jgi:16S rRNA (adenine(1408)-N(1))-methyltransferase
VLDRARREPAAFVIGVDANAAAMAESSLRAARSTSRRGLPNALFVVASAESPPDEILRRANLVTISFPWGSLLRGTLGLDAAAAAGISAIVAPGGSVEALVSVMDRDVASLGTDPLGESDGGAIRSRWARHGLELVTFERSSAAAVAAAGSTWARRLGRGRSPGERSVWRLVLRRRRAAGDG